MTTARRPLRIPQNSNHYEPSRKKSASRPLRTGGLGYGYYSTAPPPSPPSPTIILTYLPNTVPSTFLWDGVTFTLSSVVANTYSASTTFNPSTTVPYSTNLVQATIGNSVTSFAASAFGGCSALTSVTIGNSVTSIGASAFNSCSALTSVTIGNSVTSIGVSAFNSCTALTSIIIPNSVTSIGNDAFIFSGLTDVTISDATAVYLGGLLGFTWASPGTVSTPDFYNAPNTVTFTP